LYYVCRGVNFPPLLLLLSLFLLLLCRRHRNFRPFPAGHPWTHRYQEMLGGLKSFTSESQQKALFQILGAVLLLGEVTFKKAGDGSVLDSVPKQLAGLLGSSQAEMERGLTNNTRVARGERVEAKLTPEQAASSRDSLAKVRLLL